MYPLLNPCHDVMGKTGLVVVAVQGAPSAHLIFASVKYPSFTSTPSSHSYLRSPCLRSPQLCDFSCAKLSSVSAQSISHSRSFALVCCYPTFIKSRGISSTGAVIGYSVTSMRSDVVLVQSEISFTPTRQPLFDFEQESVINQRSGL